MPAPLIGAAIGAVGTIGGALMSSRSTDRAADQANEAQQAATQAQLQLGRESMGLQREIYDRNSALLNPWVQRGNIAGDSYNALLGLPAAPQPAPAAPTGGAAPVTGGLPTGGAPAPAFPSGIRDTGIGPGQPGQPFTNTHGVQGAVVTGPRGRTWTDGPAQPVAPRPTTATPQAAPVNAMTANRAFENFANSAGMKFQLKTGTNALNNMYAGRGMIESGAAMKGINDYAQNMALNNYFMPYMNMLDGQSRAGAQSGAAIAGVGSQFGASAGNVYANMGNAMQNGANSASNAAIARGVGNANMWSGIGSALGSLGSSFFTPRAGG